MDWLIDWSIDSLPCHTGSHNISIAIRDFWTIRFTSPGCSASFTMCWSYGSKESTKSTNLKWHQFFFTFLLNGVENPESRKPLSKSKAWDVSHFKDFELRKVFKTFNFWEDRGRPVCSADGRPGGFLFLGSRRRQNLRGQSVDILGPWKVSLKMLRLVAAHIICRCHILYRCNVYIYTTFIGCYDIFWHEQFEVAAE